ncbi:peptidoglycan recognition protein 1 [Aspergillus nanangensis]|uniref:Peptidoglycan recognition protein 1 n=1 Tax=Aspergillus nanangensis TaxID=2582783 RepID=A0AAD4GRB4_ASPNN|nr:peptidoglycan recognition protein 1 [Aspergillus nanangensis]
MVSTRPLGLSGSSKMARTLLTITTLLAIVQNATAMYFVSRDGWGARAPREAYTPMTNALGVKIHYLGTFFSGIEHSQCDDHMRSTQNYQMDDSPEDYFDFAYSLAVCQHGYVYDGRGKGHRSGANGNQVLNANHYAVVAFLAKQGLTQPNTPMITGIQDAIAYLRRAGAGNEIKGHRDGYATECPGAPLYALVQDGTLDPGKLWNGGSHTVANGETLGDISLKYNVPRKYIIDVNDLKEPYELVIGDVLEIPARGVPLGQLPPDGGGNEGGGSSGDLTPFPGAEWFKSQPNSAIVTAMGKRLVAEGCGKYASGPGPQWTDVDQASYKCWQQKLGYTGADADGWPGQSSWDQLKVPLTEDGDGSSSGGSGGGGLTPFPGADFFQAEPRSDIITAMGKRLVAEGCGKYSVGPGPQWTDADRASYRCWQGKLGYTGADADGWPGQTSWDQLKVPATEDGDGSSEPFPGASWFQGSPNSPIITAMGRRLVAEGCGKYSVGPGPQWSDADRESYKCWQVKLGYTGADADGWPGATSWDQLKVPSSGGTGGTGGSTQAFPGTAWFKTEPNSLIITAMGKRLVSVGCNKYSSGPGTQWSDADRESYKCWQQQLGYTGADADGWPGQSSWDALKVPNTDNSPNPVPVLFEPFPGAAYFTAEPSSWIVNEMSLRLVQVGCDKFSVGPGPEWTDDTRASYKCWQQQLGYSGANADGWPGQASWDALKVHRVTPLPVEPFPGTAWFKSSPNSPIITEMGKRLVAQGCGQYSSGPGPQWTDTDRSSFRCWQRVCGYTNSAVDGWPDAETWEKLVVPRVSG